MNGRLVLATIIAIGFMSLIALSMYATIADTAQRIVDGSMGALGVALGNAIAGIFRTDQADEQRAKNTSAAFEGIKAAINASPSGATTIHAGDAVTMERAE